MFNHTVKQLTESFHDANAIQQCVIPLNIRIILQTQEMVYRAAPRQGNTTGYKTTTRMTHANEKFRIHEKYSYMYGRCVLLIRR